MIANFVLKSGKVRPFIITNAHQFGEPQAKSTNGIPDAIWDRRHEGLVDGVVVLDPATDQPGDAFDETPAAGLFLSVAQVSYDANGAPGTWNNGVDVPFPAPPSPSPEFVAAQSQAAAQGHTLASARALNAAQSRGG